MRAQVFGSILALALANTAVAQTPLFLSLEPADPGGSPPPTVNAYYDIEIDFDALKHAPEELEIGLPGGVTFIAHQTEFLYRAGYASRTEWDPPGTPPIYPIPGLPDDWFSYRWAGGNAEYDVALTVIEGRMTGLITGPKRYGIQRQTSGDYRMADIRPAGFPRCGVGEPLRDGLHDEALTLQLDLTIDLIREIVEPTHAGTERGSSVVRTDLLIPWTEQARIDAGGSPGDPNDTTALYDLIQTAVDNAQTAFQNSLTSARVTRYVTARVTGLT